MAVATKGTTAAFGKINEAGTPALEAPVKAGVTAATKVGVLPKIGFGAVATEISRDRSALGAEKEARKRKFFEKQGVPPESGVTIYASLFIILI